MIHLKIYEDYRIGNGYQNFKSLGHDKFKIGNIVKASPMALDPKLLRHDSKYFKILDVDEDENEGIPYKIQDIFINYWAFWINETEITYITSEELEEIEMQLQAKKYNLLKKSTIK